jgi:hypothetical protein
LQFQPRLKKKKLRLRGMKWRIRDIGRSDE